MKKVNVITLGCSKNIVDSEYLMKQLQVGGWDVYHDSNNPNVDVVIVNTCGFIADAKEESIDTILSLVEAKKSGQISKIFVMGCLSQRYKEELTKEIPEVDGYYGVDNLPDILQDLNSPFSTENSNKRLLTTPNHFAYLKIAEGCNWGCSFCAIPLIRGKFVSKPIPELIEQTKSLVSEGVREIILIAQDTTFYGKDIYGERKIAELVDTLAQIDGLEWIRIHYTYPFGFPDDLLDVMARNPKVCKYLDIPLQHINNRILKSMKRRISNVETIELVNKIRTKVPGIAIRTTMLVGYPGETEEEFNELLNFVSESRFDRLGVFAYSPEENTPSENLNDSVLQNVKHERVERLMEVQRNISREINENRVGQVYRVVVDREEGGFYACRTEFDSPEVDQEVLIKQNNRQDVNIGNFYFCKITSADDYDLYGDFIEKK
ncbi:MAG TPA: 30S ribosomal protein S12 methylthiotransferase RimO [Tenuifilaceae bacterium]|nr:30S ribosomal protein S12 methylthiotransferase RimO [Tenuifilaceae bacterium]HPE18273.1 30S ribosomal protein S12 methylthiotransferase RimO [Tenuifilaceae bacterium]HRX67528.1 30S ribosomal protein S12 methylthiotransferase RimO [Tenuifilaceae bacterium]